MTMKPGHAPLDRWSLVHLASGIGLGLIPVSWPWALALLVGFEVLEAGLRRIRRHGGGLFEYESWPNIIADVVVGVAGYAVARLTLAPYLPWGP
jgi:hypothetical protein